MADPNAHLEHADLSGVLPAGPSKGRIVKAHPLYTTSVVDDVRDQSWMLSAAEVAQFEGEYERKWARHQASPVRALGALSAAAYRERITCEKALNAPFVDAARERFNPAAFAAERSERSERSGAALAGFTTSKTKVPEPREEIEIDLLQSRVRRLGKAVRNSAHSLDASAHLSGSFRWTRVFVTLTYREVEDWKAGHIGAFTRALRKWFQRVAKVPMRMVWVLELQKREAVHYHCMIWIPARAFFPKPDECGWWPHGRSNRAFPKGGIQRPVSYMAKYASKVTTGQASRVPKGARMHGACGLDKEGKRWVRFWRAPLFARDALGGAADIRKVNGGYMDRETGVFIESPWKVTLLPGGRVIAWRIVPPTNEGVSQ